MLKIFFEISILTLLIIVDPKIALTVFFFIGLSYGIIYKFSHRYVTRLGKENLKNNKLRFNVISEAFSAIKQIKLKGLEHIYLKNYYLNEINFHSLLFSGKYKYSISDLFRTSIASSIVSTKVSPAKLKDVFNNIGVFVFM